MKKTFIVIFVLVLFAIPVVYAIRAYQMVVSGLHFASGLRLQDMRQKVDLVPSDAGQDASGKPSTLSAVAVLVSPNSEKGPASSSSFLYRPPPWVRQDDDLSRFLDIMENESLSQVERRAEDQDSPEADESASHVVAIPSDNLDSWLYQNILPPNPADADRPAKYEDEGDER